MTKVGGTVESVERYEVVARIRRAFFIRRSWSPGPCSAQKHHVERSQDAIGLCEMVFKTMTSLEQPADRLTVAAARRRSNP